MGKLIWILGLWLVGIGQVEAVELHTPESLHYRVYWGLIPVGNAVISYAATSSTYVVRAVVKDDSSLIDMDDMWESRGRVTAAEAFIPDVYSVKQAENSYRSDKTMTFDRKAGLVRYVNKLDSSDVAQDLPLKDTTADAKDALAEVFAWRAGGIEDLKQPAKAQVVNVKRLITLQREAAVASTMTLDGREVKVWRVRLTIIKGDKLSKDSWTVYLKDDANLTPVQIIAATKFGTFRATLVE